MWLDTTEGNKHFKEHPLSVSGSLECGGKGTQGSVWVGNRAHVIWSAHLPPAKAAALNQYSAKLSLVFTFTWLLPWCAARVEQPLPDFCGTCHPPPPHTHPSASSSFTSLHGRHPHLDGSKAMRPFHLSHALTGSGRNKAKRYLNTKHYLRLAPSMAWNNDY